MSPASKYANALLPSTLALFGAFIAVSSQSVISFFHTKFVFMVMPINKIGTRYGMNLILEGSNVLTLRRKYEDRSAKPIDGRYTWRSTATSAIGKMLEVGINVMKYQRMANETIGLPFTPLERTAVRRGGDGISLYFLREFTERIEKYIRPKIMRDADIVDMSMKDVSAGISGSACGLLIGMKSHLRQ